MSDVLLNKLKKEKLVLVDDDEVYKLIGDYSDVETKNDFEFQHMQNSDDTIMLSSREVIRKLRNGWQIINVA